MKKKNTGTYLPLFASAPYYAKKDFQFPVTAQAQTVTATTVLKNNSGITLLYFRNGHGKAIVNTRSYPVHNGLLMVLSAYHYYQIQADSKALELTQCRLSYDTFLYMAANPYYKFSELLLNVDPLASLLEGSLLTRTEAVLDELVSMTARHKSKGGDTEFFLCMKLMGIMQKTIDRNLWQERLESE